MVKELNISKRIELLIKVILIITTPLLSLMLAKDISIYSINNYSYIIVILLSFSLTITIMKRIRISKLNSKILMVSSLVSMYIMKYFVIFANIKLINGINKTPFKNLKNYVSSIVGIISLPSLIFFIYLFIKYIIPKVIKFLKTLTNVEKKYLFIFTIIGFIVTLVISFNTTAFTSPLVNGYGINYDVIYTTDSYGIVNNDAFMNIMHEENDIRQPLFGVFALPFGFFARIISNFLFFIPNNLSYGFSLMFTQFILVAITNIMIARLLKLKDQDKKYLYLLFGVTYPYLVFTITVEQYVVALFYLILTIYSYEKSKKINYSYIGAAGTLVTTGIIFPLVSHAKEIKNWVKDIVKAFLVFLSFMIFSGQIIQVLYIKQTLNHLMCFGGGVDLTNRFYQFTNFVRGLFFASKGELNTVGHTSYQLLKVNNIDIIGVVILGLMLISFILNRKNKMAIISFLWVIFSFVLLCLIGWGTAENGLILYSMYFSWAYLILYYLLLRKLFNNKKSFNLVYYTSIFVIGICTILEFINLLSVMTKYY